MCSTIITLFAKHNITTTTPHTQGKVRLDTYLSAQLPDASRAKLSASIKAGLVRINRAVVCKPSHAVKAGDVIVAALLPPEPCTVSASYWSGVVW